MHRAHQEALSSPSALTRHESARALGEMQVAGAAPALLQLMKAPMDGVEEWEGLVEADVKRAERKVKRALLRAAQTALAHIAATEDGFEAVYERAARDEDARRILTMLAPDRVVGALGARLRDHGAAKEAVLVISGLVTDHEGALESPTASILPPTCPEVLPHFCRQEMDSLAAVARKSPDAFVRSWATRALAGMYWRSEEALEVLHELRSSDASEEVRERAATAIAFHERLRARGLGA